MKYLLNTYYVSDTVLGDVLSKIKKIWFVLPLDSQFPLCNTYLKM